MVKLKPRRCIGIEDRHVVIFGAEGCFFRGTKHTIFEGAANYVTMHIVKS